MPSDRVRPGATNSALGERASADPSTGRAPAFRSPSRSSDGLSGTEHDEDRPAHVRAEVRRRHRRGADRRPGEGGGRGAAPDVEDAGRRRAVRALRRAARRRAGAPYALISIEFPLPRYTTLARHFMDVAFIFTINGLGVAGMIRFSRA